uniref:Serine protease 16 n=1 Tax=Latimeria chalumnae TaxID=7897 RepID=H3BFZ0_LATCH
MQRSTLELAVVLFGRMRPAWPGEDIKERVLQHREFLTKQSLFSKQKLPLGPVPNLRRESSIESFLQQPLDHFNRQNNQTYKQRYWVNGDFWRRPNGPVFLFIGGESALFMFDVLAGEHVDLAEKYGALVVAVEHRYYGASINPDGLTEKNIRFLSSQQALADLASFHIFLTQQYNLTLNNTWICFGGSYPGSLSAWFRLKFPHLVFAAVATSAPVRAELDFTGYNKVVAESLMDPVVGGSKKCRDAVTEAFHAVDKAIHAGNISQLEKDFQACSKLNGSLDETELVSDLADIFMGAVQYNLELPGYNIAVLCDIMTNATLGSAYARLIQANQKFMQSSFLKCVDYSYQKSLAELSTTNISAKGIGLRQWYYQTCTEFGYYQTCEDDSCVFSPLMTLSSQLDLCTRVFGISAKSVQQAVQFTNEYYGADQPRSSRILFVNGNIDPWHALSVLKNQTESEVAIYINGTAHCANMRPSSPSDPKSLIEARREIDYQIGEWLKAARKEHLRL